MHDIKNIEQVIEFLPQVREGLPPIDYPALVIQTARDFPDARGRADLLKRIIIEHYNGVVLPAVTSSNKEYRELKISIQKACEWFERSRPWVSKVMNGKRPIFESDAIALAQMTCSWLKSSPADWLLFEAVFPYDRALKRDYSRTCAHIMLQDQRLAAALDPDQVSWTEDSSSPAFIPSAECTEKCTERCLGDCKSAGTAEGSST